MEDKRTLTLAYRFLNRLGHELLQCTGNYALTKNDSGKLNGIFYNYPDELPSTVPISEYPDHEKAEEIQAAGSAVSLQLKLIGVVPHAAFTLETLDVCHGNAVTLWKQYGYPKNLTREQHQEIYNFAEALNTKKLTADSFGILNLNLKIEPWSILFLSEDGK